MTLSEHPLGRPARAAAFDAHQRAAAPAEAARQAWQRWEMASLSKPRAAPRATAAPTANPPAEAPQPVRAPRDDLELERLRREAREAGALEGRQEGWAQGHAEGHAAGLAAGQAQVQAQAERLLALAAALPEALARADAEIADSLLALALDVARQVVHRSLRADPHSILPLVQDLLHAEPALQGEPRLLLHPDDLALVESALGPELQTAGWQLRTDETITRGGCRVQAATGAKDATLETRWARVAAAFGRSGALSG
jgi:flagellar assembly protein FliH